MSLSLHIEALESRRFLSTAPTYNFASLVGYDRLGSSWKYSSTVTLITDGDTDTKTASAKVAVAASKVRYDGQDCSAVKFSSSDLTISTAWYSNSKGTFQTLSLYSGDTLTLKLHDTRVAPRTMTLGQTYTDTGTIDATVRGTIDGYAVNGSFRGTDAVSTTLWKNQRVRTRAGSFDTVKGSYDVSVSGKLTLRVAGRNVTANVNVTDSSVFWAAPSVGIIKQIESAKVSFKVPNYRTISVAADATSSLVSYVLA